MPPIDVLVAEAGVADPSLMHKTLQQKGAQLKITRNEEGILWDGRSWVRIPPSSPSENLGTIHMYLKRLEGRKSKVLEDLEDEPLVVQLRNGKVYGGRLDEYYYNEGGVIALYSCKLLDKKSHKWVDHDIMIKSEGKLMADPMPDFWIGDIKEIFVLPEEYRNCNPSSSDLEDALQIYIDPHYRPITGVPCSWDVGEGWKTEKDHTIECEAHLHEALSFLVTEAEMGISLNPKNKDENRRRFEDAYAYIRRRLLMYGARIP